MNKKAFAITAYMLLMLAMLTACGNYKPPYQRGYDEGYAAGLEASGGASANGISDASSQERGLSALTAKSVSETQDEATGESADDDGAASSDGADVQDMDVLGEGPDTEADPDEADYAQVWSGRIIIADAVNEALYSNPEVIDGLRSIYNDPAIFGEFVGDSETNLIHRVGGEHFSQLGYDTIVVFDESMTLQDVLDEGFYTKCSCMDEE